jgi:ATP-binding cassette subfamily F protein 3
VVEGKDVAKSYGPKHVFSNANFVIERGDRIALVGVNGAGKSTLIKLLAGLEPATEGDIKLGHNVQVDYFAQDQYKALDPQSRMLDDLFEASPRSTQTELRNLLGCFLFSEDDVFKTVGVLSGGERNRYALARMLLHPSNFLLLDEPTNHLDLRAKDVLLESLQKFTGTVVFVSHDRYFIDKLATRIFEIESGHVEVFPGNYEDYLWRKQGKPDAAAEAPDPQLSSNGAKSPSGPGSPSQETAREPEASASTEPKQKRLNPIKLKQMKDRCQELEEEIARLEAVIAQAETVLQNFVSAEETQRQTAVLERSKNELAQRIGEWEELAETLEAHSEA